MTKRKMHPAWAFFFKDKYEVLHNQQKMSLAEVLFTVGVLCGVAYLATQQDMCHTCDMVVEEVTMDRDINTEE